MKPVNTARAEAGRDFEEAILRFEAALSRIEAALAAPAAGEEAAHLDALDALAQDAAPLSKRQKTLNTSIVNELRQQRALQRGVVELIRCQTSLVEFLRTVKPYVDTRDFADVLNAIADEQLKRSDALLARDRQRELKLTDVEAELNAIRARLDELQRTVAK